MRAFSRYNPIGEEEKRAVQSVMDSGVLSQYIGAWHEDFNGGVQVKSFENELASYFGIPHAVVFNSLTSGLIAAIGALGIHPGDEVLVTPWSMSATATAIMIWGGIPVFVDIEPEYFGVDPELIESAITDRTRGIVVADIFGHGARLDEIAHIAKKHNLFVVEDVAQAPGIKMQNKFLGTWGDVGGFSLNYHKHIHTGEGGFCICKDDEVAMKMRLIRNHAESAVAGSPVNDLHNMVGFNFRMGEMEAAIGREQLKKLPVLLEQNQRKAVLILGELAETSALSTTNCAVNEHAYYVLPFLIQDEALNRSSLIAELERRGVPGLVRQYVNIHKLPMYREKIAFGSYPWAFSNKPEAAKESTEMPVAEELNDKKFFGLLISMFDMTDEDAIWIGRQIAESCTLLLSEGRGDE